MTVFNYDVLDNSVYEVDYTKNRIILNSLKLLFNVTQSWIWDLKCL